MNNVIQGKRHRKDVYYGDNVSWNVSSNSNDDNDKWKVAKDEQMKSLSTNQTWDLVKINPKDNLNVIGSKWVLKEKIDETGNIVKLKARLVAQGYSQLDGIDFDSTNIYSPVGRYKSIRVILSLAAQYGLELQQLDIESAFLNAPIDDVV